MALNLAIFEIFGTVGFLTWCFVVWSLFSTNFFYQFFLESEEADKLEELKKTTNEENAKTNKRRMKFQAQDSVLVDTFGGSQEE